MTYIVDENCIKCKLMDCVEVCPVDCFYEGKNMLVIHPDECIDCGVCEPECPVDAIHSDTDPNIEKWAELNRIYSEKANLSKRNYSFIFLLSTTTIGFFILHLFIFIFSIFVYFLQLFKELRIFFKSKH